MFSPENITKKDFESTLLRYPALLKAVSASKSGKNDEESLEDLDWFRFMSAPNRYMKREGDTKDIPLEKDDVVRLVKWKLKHGKFRPNLLKLASCNLPQTVASTSLAAFAMPDTISALRTLALLTGIGPATASLLLSVHDPENVLFFSDEAYRWLVCDGKEQAIKYSLKEYEVLEVKARALMERLDVGARDVERVAFVIMRGGAEVWKKETVLNVRNARTTPSDRRKSGEKEKDEDAEVVHEENATAEKILRSSSSRKAVKDKGKEKADVKNPRSSSSLKVSENEHMTQGDGEVIGEEEILKAFEANAKKTISSARHRARGERKPKEDGPKVEIPDAKTLARKASQRIMELQPPLERQRTAEEKLEAVVEDLMSKGAKIARVVSPAPLRNRRISRNPEALRHSQLIIAAPGSEHEKSESLKSTSPQSADAISPAPLFRHRDGSRRYAETEKKSETPVQGMPQSVKRSSSEHKGREPEPQTAASKRPRRGRSAQAGESDAATLASVDCTGCLHVLKWSN